MSKIQVILPAVSQNALSNGLRQLTRAIVEKRPERWRGGLLGGHYGYGAAWDDEVFSMHHYCWCDKDDCPWCGYDEERDHAGGAPHFHHKATGFKVWWYKYIGRSMETKGGCDWAEVLSECLASVRGTQ